MSSAAEFMLKQLALVLVALLILIVLLVLVVLIALVVLLILLVTLVVHLCVLLSGMVRRYFVPAYDALFENKKILK